MWAERKKWDKNWYVMQYCELHHYFYHCIAAWYRTDAIQMVCVFMCRYGKKILYWANIVISIVKANPFSTWKTRIWTSTDRFFTPVHTNIMCNENTRIWVYWIYNLRIQYGTMPCTCRTILSFWLPSTENRKALPHSMTHSSSAIHLSSSLYMCSAMNLSLISPIALAIYMAR